MRVVLRCNYERLGQALEIMLQVHRIRPTYGLRIRVYGKNLLLLTYYSGLRIRFYGKNLRLLTYYSGLGIRFYEKSLLSTVIKTLPIATFV